MEGGGPPIDWAALAPHIEHGARESIVEALRWVGPLSALDLEGVLDDPGVLVEIGRRPAGASIEKVYFFGPSS